MRRSIYFLNMWLNNCFYRFLLVWFLRRLLMLFNFVFLFFFWLLSVGGMGLLLVYGWWYLLLGCFLSLKMGVVRLNWHHLLFFCSFRRSLVLLRSCLVFLFMSGLILSLFLLIRLFQFLLFDMMLFLSLLYFMSCLFMRWNFGLLLLMVLFWSCFFLLLMLYLFLFMLFHFSRVAFNIFLMMLLFFNYFLMFLRLFVLLMLFWMLLSFLLFPLNFVNLFLHNYFLFFSFNFLLSALGNDHLLLMFFLCLIRIFLRLELHLTWDLFFRILELNIRAIIWYSRIGIRWSFIGRVRGIRFSARVVFYWTEIVILAGIFSIFSILNKLLDPIPKQNSMWEIS